MGVLAELHGEFMLWDTNYYECDDEYEIQDMYDNFCEELTEVLTEVNPDNKDWYCKAENFGWRKISGEKTFMALTGKAFLSEILPETECTFKIYEENGKIKVNNRHHDSPYGDEWYYIEVVK